MSSPSRRPWSPEATWSAAPTSTWVIASGLVHRRLDAVEPELVGRLLGVIDDVVERAGERVDVGCIEVGPALGEPPQDVVRDAIAVVLALPNLNSQLGVLGIFCEQVA